MTKSVRSLIKLVLGLLAALPGAPTTVQAEKPQPAQAGSMTMSAFIARVRNDAAFRERFAQNPRAVMRESGIDPAPYDLPDRLSQAQLDRLLADWSERAGPSPAPPPISRPGPALAVYGPPARPPLPPSGGNKP